MAIVEEFDYLCRLCGTKMNILMGFPIFEAGEQVRNIDKKIAACLPVQVSLTDQLPKVICQECAFKLDETVGFREKALQTEGMFIQMLKTINKDNVDNLNEVSINELQGNIERLANGINEIENTSVNKDNIESSIHTLPVIDAINLSDREQVMAREDITREDAEIEVTDFHIDGDTVRMVNEQIRQVSNQAIAMQLANDMSVTVENLAVSGHLTHLDLNYVTSIAASRPHDVTEKETLRFVDEIKESQSYSSSRSESEIGDPTCDDSLNNPSSDGSHTFSLPSTSEVDEVADGLLVQYTKSAKDGLLQSALNSPSIDENESNWYVCPFCSNASPEPTNLIVHFEQHFCTCTSCDLFFTSIQALNVHNQDFHEGQHKENIFSQNKEYLENEPQRQKSSEKKSVGPRPKWTPKVCPQCGKEYRTNYKLQEHMRTHTGEKPYQCTMCDKAFRSKIGLAQHTATHTGQFDFSCSTCGKGFQCKSYLIVHQRVHSDLKPFTCSICNQKFKTKQSLLDHENRHMGVKPYPCEICGRCFITKGLCKSHQKVHSGTDNRQYPCTVCNKMFVSKSYLNTHLRIHTGEKPYLCDACGKGFLTRVDLTIHMTVHTGEKNFKCDLCDKLFARRSAMRCHRRSHTGERPYSCEICGKKFTQYSPMKIHKRLHTGERPYKCDLCGKTFVSRSTMTSHRKKHSPNEAQELRSSKRGAEDKDADKEDATSKS